MIYLLSQEWESTKGNHAGMSHLCRLIHNCHPNDTVHICVPSISFGHTRPLFHLFYFLTAIRLCFTLKRSDKLILMEYLNPTRNQKIVAAIIRKIVNCKIVALIHLVPSEMYRFYPNNEELFNWFKYIDTIITFGSSLTDHLLQRGVMNKTITTYHYVDSNYYQRTNNTVKRKDFKLTAIFMGNMKRDYDSLINIVSSNPNIYFIYCKGRSNRDTSELNNYNNIEIHGYLEEKELKNLMEKSDVSLNLMLDTIGSNVITTSMSMGLVMLVSDVGSIHDYCDDSNSFFCKNIEDFNYALQELSTNPIKLESMKESSYKKSLEFTIERFFTDINSI